MGQPVSVLIVGESFIDFVKEKVQSKNGNGGNRVVDMVHVKTCISTDTLGEKQKFCEQGKGKTRNGACKLSCVMACTTASDKLVEHYKSGPKTQSFPKKKFVHYCYKECTVSCDQPDRRVKKTFFQRRFED